MIASLLSLLVGLVGAVPPCLLPNGGPGSVVKVKQCESVAVVLEGLHNPLPDPTAALIRHTFGPPLSRHT